MYQQNADISSIDKDAVDTVRKSLSEKGIAPKDAMGVTGGRDYLEQIWKTTIGVPMGVAVVGKDTPQETSNNIFYELGIMDALGKETVVITDGVKHPSNLVRTGHIKYESLDKELDDWINEILGSRVNLYEEMADLATADPIAAIGFNFHAYLISGLPIYINKIEEICKQATLQDNHSKSVENLLLASLRNSRSQQRKAKTSN